MRNKSLQKILLVCAQKSGKTKLVSTYQNLDYTEYIQTIGVDFCVKTLNIKINRKLFTTKLQIWDTAGQERFQVIAQSYFRGASAAIILFNMNDADSFNSCEKYLQQIVKQCNYTPKILLLGNSFSKERQVSTDEAVYFAEQHNLMYTELTELNYENVDDVFTRLATSVLHSQLEAEQAQQNSNKYK
ncbi:Rab11 [Hexamita inflata]|uniref:Rab11 n=1 Tax=Hexamita inflata TaxID=28002 RepID=A0AA86RQR9_9EUKA|nr:Rab11 [Hexamita inflata]CAI9978985.1 Rab11 [Hexamita inflata]